jgi:hypothetical protein
LGFTDYGNGKILDDFAILIKKNNWEIGSGKAEVFQDGKI